MEMEKTAYMSMLYDFYGGLLTAKQKEYLELYYEQDLSLSEISEELNVSRQAVYDNIKRSEQILAHYESVLRLIEQYAVNEKHLKVLQEYVRTHYQEDAVLHRLVQEIGNGEDK
ncbi:putative DNA-binding protein [Granulicatella sp. zg-ZJ]|uniref:putative DNA-binding protein n=1 Tax=Granulicatella sp. zg-ZJ TaxID=2678504 RepID=UPI0013D6A2BE|nr:putative DNA-binding protein [Granulicatella sp. zg-ZJ]MBS4750547.1 putative DNA-binding protein [Carnobacteriaceae bacterium zg-ZUI78]NEW63449.1 putative DNA-binding protein [Granulicatella sp. zg-ZJ]